MSDRTDKPEIRKYLTAFADGELDVEQTLAVLEHMAMHPEATKRVLHQQQLRQAVSRAMGGASPAAPAHLVAQVERLVAQEEVAAASTTAAAGPRPWWRSRESLILRSAVAAMAAVVLIVLGVVTQRVFAPEPAAPTAARGHALPPALVASAVQTHVRCGRVLSHATLVRPAAGFAQVTQVVHGAVGASAAVPDLSELGYQFVGAEPCPLPGSKTIHLLYRSTDAAGVRDNLSLFVQRDEGQLDVLADTLCAATTGDLAHPMLIWRSGGVVYYIIGDAMDPVVRAATLAGAPPMRVQLMCH